jgi:hypothetical protein
MARNRLPGEAPIPPTRGPTRTPLSLLLHARRFRTAMGAERVSAHLLAAGAQVASDAAAWVGASAPPVDAPSLSLGVHPGTLGPRSFGFLNNAPTGAVAALDLPAGPLPRAGRLAVVVPGREALPDLLPLFVARELPIAWLISVGDGDPGEVISFLSEDAATDAIALALGPGARPPALRSTLGAKPTVVLGGDALCRAVARRAGAHVVDRIGEWLAIAALLGTGATLEDPVEVWIAGGGEAWVRGELARYEIDAPVRILDERDPEALAAAVASAASPRLVIVIGAGVTLPGAPPDVRLVAADTSQPEQVSRLLKALGAELQRGAGRPGATGNDPAAEPVDPALAARVRSESEGTLRDHDCKRLLKAWGLRVSRQGPTGTPTGAVKLARMIGLPAVIARGDEERVAETLPEVRRLAALLLERAEGEGDAGARSVMVRERYPDAPRARVRVAAERGVGATMKVSDAVALLPLDAAEAAHLAQRAGVRRAGDQRTLAALLIQLGACALAENAAFEVELFVGGEPAVVRASGSLRPR